MQAGGPAAVSSQDDTLKFTDAASCRAWLERLPRIDLVECHAQLSGQMHLLAQAKLKPGVRLELLEQVRQTVAEIQANYALICRGRPVPLEEGDRAIWDSVVGLWQTMASAYDALIVDMAGGAQEIASRAALICQRALRYTALAMDAHNHVYHRVSGELWQQLHRLYVFAENAGVAGTTVNDPVGRSVPGTTCAGTYVHALLAQLAQPNALSVRRMELIDRWLERWEGLVTLSPDQLTRSTIPALAVNLAAPKGVGFAKDVPTAGARHLDLENLSKALRQAIASLKQGQTPAQLGLGELRREACEQLLELLHVQWCAAGTGRTGERNAVEIRVMIASTIPAIHFHITGRAFRPPGAELTARERREQDILGSISDGNEQAMASQRSAAVEVWLVVNKSESGMLGMWRDPTMGGRISHNQLLALKTGTATGMHLGIVQRLEVDQEKAIWAGLRLVSGAAQAAAARLTDASGPDAGKYDRALVVPEEGAQQAPASIFLLPGWYAPGRILEVYVDRPRKIKLQALLERGPNFERATFAAV